jgi:hypothetical protein
MREAAAAATQQLVIYAFLAVDALFTVRYILHHARRSSLDVRPRNPSGIRWHADTQLAMNDGQTATMRRPNSNENASCVFADRPFARVMADGLPILARAKLSALRSRGKCVAGYSPPQTSL